MKHLSNRVSASLASTKAFFSFLQESAYTRLQADPTIANFVFGNPQEMPLQGVVETLKHWVIPQNKNWFAYKDNVVSAQSAVAAALTKRLNMPFAARDIAMTTGAFAALSASIAALVNPGDEVIYHNPPWFFYESITLSWGGIPVALELDPKTFDLDLKALAAAISPRTRVVIVNSPHNPTGKIYPAATLKALSTLLEDASKRIGRPIYLLSDESYYRIVFEGRDCPSPSQFYPHTLMAYTYAKTLLIPGQRLGYIALPPTMPDRESLSLGLQVALTNAGYLFPNALMQYALPDLEHMCIDLSSLERRRDRVVSELRAMGYETNCPEGTFYILVRSPIRDDQAFCEHLVSHGILCLPGEVLKLPGYFRISLTASDPMVEQALPGFKAALSMT